MAISFGETGGQLFGKIFSGVLWVGLGLILISVVGGVMWYLFFYKKKFDISVTIYSERANDKENIIFDKAAILKDRKTKTNFLRLWSTKIELTCPPFNIMQRSNKGDYLELRRTTQNHFFFLTPKRIVKSEIIRADGKVYPISTQEARMVDPNMDFWAAKRKGQNKRMFDPESLLFKLLPYVPIILGGAILIFVLYILMQYLPQILSELTKLVEGLNRQQLAEVTTGLFYPLV